VSALTRSVSKRDALGALGASVAIADALDRDGLIKAVKAASPTHVIHQLTALPGGGPRRARDLEATNRLRIEGTRNLLDAAMSASARRLVAGSFALLSPRGPIEHDVPDAATAAVHSMEDQVMEMSRRGSIEGVVVRYGMFYGLEARSTLAMIDMVQKRRLPVVRRDAGLLPLIHVDDAVSATVRALTMAPAGAAYDIVDDRAVSMTEIVEALAEYTGSPAPIRIPAWVARLVAPYAARFMSIRMPLSNRLAKADLEWGLKYPTLRDGLARMFRRAA
jgi:nucleoside-diphosphate-sugar epimerase